MQTNQFLSKEKNQSSKSVDKANQTTSKDKSENKNDSKTKKNRYWEPLIPRSDRKDRLEIW